MSYYKKVVGTRIYLSPMHPNDADLYAKWVNDFSVTDGLGSSYEMATEETEKKWISENSSEFHFSIVRFEDDVLIGNCGFQEKDLLRQCGEVGLLIGEEEYRNQGYGSEALALLVDYGFRYLNMHNIMLRVFSFNERAIQCYQKTGFREIGRRRESYYVRGRFYDEIYMDILKKEWYTCINNTSVLQ